jgi:hypothetical protein
MYNKDISMKIIFSFFICIICFFFVVPYSYAIDDPLSHPNNKVGIHILFDTELSAAAKLVNSNGGDWGYVTIPMQVGDRNFPKWQKFMKDAKKYHVIPIIRLATNADSNDTTLWRKPTAKDITDFANFLQLLDWPTQNRYVIIFNEVNRGDEWGGAVKPEEYAQLLSYAVTVLKSKSSDYFIVSAGLDNAAPQSPPTYMNQYEYMKAIQTAVPGIFNQVDGLSSHSYPNPAFSQPPDPTSPMGVASFQQERQLAQQLSGKNLPVFITETGWDASAVSEDVIKQYYQQAFDTIWNDPNIIAITPFLMDARGGPFQKFSFLTEKGTFTQHYTVLKELLKTKGAPAIPMKVLAAETTKVSPTEEPMQKEEESFFLTRMFHQLLSWVKGN